MLAVNTAFALLLNIKQTKMLCAECKNSCSVIICFVASATVCYAANALVCYVAVATVCSKQMQ